MKRYILIGVLILVCGGCSYKTAPIVVHEVEYMQGRFGSSSKTIIRAEDGRTLVVLGHVDTPSRGTSVIGIHSFWGCRGIDRIKVVD